MNSKRWNTNIPVEFPEMNNRQALEAFKRGEALEQPVVRRLMNEDLINVDEVTNFDTPPGEREFLPISITAKGYNLLDRKPVERKPRTVAKERTSMTVWRSLVRGALKVKVGASVTVIISATALLLTYKYTGADDLRSKVYSPLNAELNTIGQTIAANSISRLFNGDSFAAIQRSGDFHRLPKSLQNELTTFYAEAGQLQRHVPTVTELIQRQVSATVEGLRSEESDKLWREAASARLRAESQQQEGISPLVTSTLNHTARGRGIDVRNPDKPVVALPGGPIFEVNDWLSYPESAKQIDSTWTADDFLYFDETRDMWYYRITRADLEKHKMTLADFLQPIYRRIAENPSFKALQTDEPKLLRQLQHLKDEIGGRVDEPKRLGDLLD